MRRDGSGGAGGAARGPVAALLRTLALASCAAALVAPTARAETLRQSLSATYQNNPRLDAERARLRATDEEVPRAQSGFRPQIVGRADMGRDTTETTPATAGDGRNAPWGYSLQISQSVFSGFRTTHAVNEAEATVRAGRETLRGVEQQVLLDAATAYCDVVRDQAIVRLREHNVQVLTTMLTATEARRHVREVTRTDVAQAKARRARSISQLDLARSNLKTSRAAFEKTVGHAPSGLVPPTPPLKLLPQSIEEAVSIGERENPTVVGAFYREQAARFTVDKIRGELMPDVRVEGTFSHRGNPTNYQSEQESASIAGRLTIPFYDGGDTAARVRQAKHTHVSQMQQIEQARSETQAAVSQAWSRYQAARAQLKSDQVQVEANRVALEGVREEERVGQRTLLDVLNAEQELLDSEVQLVSTRRDLVVAAYTLIAQIGRLTAPEMALVASAYDPEEHYAEVRSKWFGLDITRANGRAERLDVTVESDPEWAIDQ